MAAVVGLKEIKIEEICRNFSKQGQACIANYNSSSQVVITGDVDSIENVTPQLLEAGAMKVIPLNVSGAFHSPLMSSAKEKLGK